MIPQGQVVSLARWLVPLEMELFRKIGPIHSGTNITLRDPADKRNTERVILSCCRADGLFEDYYPKARWEVI